MIYKLSCRTLVVYKKEVEGGGNNAIKKIKFKMKHSQVLTYRPPPTPPPIPFLRKAYICYWMMKDLWVFSFVK